MTAQTRRIHGLIQILVTQLPGAVAMVAHGVVLILHSQLEELFSIAGSLMPTEARRKTLQLIGQLLKGSS